MADVETLLADFIAADRRGEAPDPLPYLERLGAADRAELAGLIDAYLVRAPRRPFDADAFAASRARPVVDDLARALGGRSGRWPALLPRLRHRAELRRAQLVERLADALGAGDRTDKVGAYYHAMERGTLPADGVSDRVLEALGRIVGEGVEALREAGRALSAGAGGSTATGPVFARVAVPDEAYADVDADAEEDDEGASVPLSADPASAAERDFVDELFTGGASAGAP